MKEEKVIPFKVYNFQVHETNIFVNNGTNLFELSKDRELTKGLGRTNQLCLEYPFLVQRNPNSLSVFNQNNINKLFTIPVKAQYCSLFSSGYLLIV